MANAEGDDRTKAIAGGSEEVELALDLVQAA
jgi:hypothetical protein